MASLAPREAKPREGSLRARPGRPRGAQAAGDAFAERLEAESLAPLRCGTVRTLQVNVTGRCNLACRVGMVFQRPNPFPLSIGRNLDLPLREHGMRSRRRRDDAIEQALRDVGLWDEVRDRLESPKEELTAAYVRGRRG